MRTREFNQNFLKNRRTARLLVRLADGPPGSLHVDLGAGRGVITEAALGLGKRILAIEKDVRFVRELDRRFGADSGVEICRGDLLEMPLPTEPYVCVGNPPFNISTQLARRWMTSPLFISAAVIIEHEFGQRITGHYGTTKLSASLGPFLRMDVPISLHPAEFHPQPRVHVAIMTSVRLEQPLVRWRDRHAYWLFVNYLFERSKPTVGASLSTLRLRGLPTRLEQTPLRDTGIADIVWLFDHVRGDEQCWTRIESFERTLPPKRRALAPGPR